ncbi:hypothetical protein IFM89_036069 [Coptis chinensis]|uniref:Pectinesterase inhibitor domain-containing protein n=1 Tax=Coptis chinensis TaxID=261450 RepID=A0A835HZV9_9MAGN|nr:hypothetical protein IFM89_036069 [Coptis chinensis]
MASFSVSPWFLLCVSFLVFFSTQSYASHYHQPKHHHNNQHQNHHRGHIINAEAVCREVHPVNYNICVSLFKSDPGARKPTKESAPKIFIKIALNNVTSAHKYARNLLQTTLDPPLKSTIITCDEFYFMSIHTVRKALLFLDKKDFGSVRKELRLVQKHFTKCESLYGKRPGLVSPLSSINKAAEQILAISIDLSRRVVAHKNKKTQ